MNLTLTESKRRLLQVLQKQRRDEAGYVKVTVVLLDKGWGTTMIAEALGLDDWEMRVTGPLVDAQHIFHERYKGCVYYLQAPVILAMGPQLVFLSTWPTVSCEMVSTRACSQFSQRVMGRTWTKAAWESASLS